MSIRDRGTKNVRRGDKIYRGTKNAHRGYEKRIAEPKMLVDDTKTDPGIKDAHRGNKKRITESW